MSEQGRREECGDLREHDATSLRLQLSMRAERLRLKLLREADKQEEHRRREERPRQETTAAAEAQLRVIDRPFPCSLRLRDELLLSKAIQDRPVSLEKAEILQEATLPSGLQEFASLHGEARQRPFFKIERSQAELQDELLLSRVTQDDIVSEYNRFAGGADLYDELIQSKKIQNEHVSKSLLMQEKGADTAALPLNAFLNSKATQVGQCPEAQDMWNRIGCGPQESVPKSPKIVTGCVDDSPCSPLYEELLLSKILQENQVPDSFRGRLTEKPSELPEQKQEMNSTRRMELVPCRLKQDSALSELQKEGRELNESNRLSKPARHDKRHDLSNLSSPIYEDLLKSKTTQESQVPESCRKSIAREGQAEGISPQSPHEKTGFHLQRQCLQLHEELLRSIVAAEEGIVRNGVLPSDSQRQIIDFKFSSRDTPLRDELLRSKMMQDDQVPESYRNAKAGETSPQSPHYRQDNQELTSYHSPSYDMILDSPLTHDYQVHDSHRRIAESGPELVRFSANGETEEQAINVNMVHELSEKFQDKTCEIPFSLKQKSSPRDLLMEFKQSYEANGWRHSNALFIPDCHEGMILADNLNSQEARQCGSTEGGAVPQNCCVDKRVRLDEFHNGKVRDSINLPDLSQEEYAQTMLSSSEELEDEEVLLPGKCVALNRLPLRSRTPEGLMQKNTDANSISFSRLPSRRVRPRHSDGTTSGEQEQEEEEEEEEEETGGMEEVHTLSVESSQGSATNEGLVVAVPVDVAQYEFSALAYEYNPDTKRRILIDSKRSQRFHRVGLLILLLFFATSAVVTVAVIRKRQGNLEVGRLLPSPRSEDVQTLIESIVGFELLQDSHSAYARALKWIIYDDRLELTTHDPSLIQRFIAAYIYISTSASGPWLSCNPSNDTLTDATCVLEQMINFNPTVFSRKVAMEWLSNTSECEWGGILCDLQGQVVGINLGKFGIFSVSRWAGHFSSSLTFYLPFRWK